ncbi:hypothetical protein ALC57_03063 [Trachymyrmex cornetzi]|uniref:Uncharacterized protein n=1 Tax=Trachymyrmex cornetzi TaxID=471704 RepID=A0A151JMI4_9HYME|nr:hypothetical protein ALC57_03063 [Trachymyrmex cornetzi]
MSSIHRSDRCANPFRKPDEKGHIGKSLRRMSKTMLQTFPDLPSTSKICSGCYRRFQTKQEDVLSTGESNNSIPSVIFDDSTTEMDVDTSGTEDDLRSGKEQWLDEILDEFKQKFHSLDWGDPLRLRILTIAPSSWSVRKLADEFNTSRHFAAKAKELKSLRGILAETTQKSGKKLPETTVEKVHEFYTSDLHSRLMPGVKDVVSLKIDGKRSLVQKRLLLLGLKELHALFKECNAEHKISFSAFAKLKPKNCILAGAAGTHSVCICTIHQNVKLMLDAIDVEKLTKDTEMPIINYKDCLSKIVCREPSPDCWLDKCKQCPGTDELTEQLSSILEAAQISNVQCSVWAGTDRSTILT